MTENLFGDILSDEAAVHHGLAGHAARRPRSATRETAHGRHGLYEPIHGSAPDIAGQDLANPLGTILSAAMLLRWSLGRATRRTAIEAAVARAPSPTATGPATCWRPAAPAPARPSSGRGRWPAIVGERIAICRPVTA